VEKEEEEEEVRGGCDHGNVDNKLFRILISSQTCFSGYGIPVSCAAIAQI
jgi:hypothetical protein